MADNPESVAYIVVLKGEGRYHLIEATWGPFSNEDKAWHWIEMHFGRWEPRKSRTTVVPMSPPHNHRSPDA